MILPTGDTVEGGSECMYELLKMGILVMLPTGDTVEGGSECVYV